jgi:Calcineurin-like phosphoesterase
MRPVEIPRVAFLAVALFVVLLVATCPGIRAQQPAQKSEQAPQQSTDGTWSFAVSGDSRNCGDVVMPAIAAGVINSGANFYWHLGDYRAIYNFDEDMQHQPERLANPLNIYGYEQIAWDDFIRNQIDPFGDLPVFLGIGNHDTTPPKTREQYIIQFADWLDMPKLREQRLRDDPFAHKLTTYYHWIQNGVDFISLDNATPDQFDTAQMTWFEKILNAAESDPQIRTIVAGMHEALPESISADHSMNQSAAGTETGRRVYIDLLNSQKVAHKHVYILSSHSHYYMDGIFNTEYWRTHGGVLPGWIIGTAGAVRYALPPESKQARAAETNVYGYLVAHVQASGEIQFTFRRLRESDVPAAVVDRYKPEFVHWCFAENSAAH